VSGLNEVLRDLTSTDVLFEKLTNTISSFSMLLADSTVQGVKMGAALGYMASQLYKAFNNIMNSVRGVLSTLSSGITGFLRVFSNIGRTITSIITRIIKLFGNLGDRVRDLFRFNPINLFKGIDSAVRGALGGLDLFLGYFDSIFSSEYVSRGEDLVNTLGSLNNVFGSDITNRAVRFSDALRSAFGVSTDEALSGISDLSFYLRGSGLSNSASIGASEQLSLLAKDLITVGVKDYNTAINQIRQGLAGRVQKGKGLGTLGINLSDESVESYLRNLRGINLTMDEMTERQKVIARYWVLMQQAQERFGSGGGFKNVADGLNSVYISIRRLKASLEEIRTTLSIGFTRLLAQLTPLILSFLNAINAAIQRVFSFVGISTELSATVDSLDGLTGYSDGLADLAEGFDEVDKAASKASGTLQSFDRINNLSSGTGTASKANDALFDALLDTSLGDTLGADLATSAADSFGAVLFDKLQGVYDKLNNLGRSITGRSDFDLGLNWDALKSSLTNIKSNLTDFFKKFGRFTLDIGFRVLDDIGAGEIINKVFSVFEKASESLLRIWVVLEPILLNTYERFIRPIVEEAGQYIIKFLDFIIQKLDSLATWFESNPQLVQSFFDKLGRGAQQVWQIIKGEGIADDATGVWRDVLGLLQALRDIFFALLPILQEVGKNLLSLFTDKVLPWLVDQLNKLADWLVNNKDQIVEFFKVLSEWAFDRFTLFVDVLSKLIDLLVQHPHLLTAFFDLAMFAQVAGFIAQLVSSIGGLLSAVMNGITLISSNLPLITSALGGVVAGVLPVVAGVSTVVLTIKKWIQEDMFGTFIKACQDMYDNFLQFTDMVVLRVFDFVQNFGDNVNSAMSSLINGLISLFNSLPTSVQNALKSLYDGFKNIVNGIRELFNALLSFLPNGFRSAFESIKNIITGVITGIGNTIRGFFDSVVEKLREIFNIGDRVNRVLNVKASGASTYAEYSGSDRAALGLTSRSSSIPVLPIIGRANGGTVQSGQLFVARENGMPELVGSFGGTTGVANNGQIVDALTSGVHNALVAFYNQRDNQRGTQTAVPQININGFGLIDRDTLNKLAQILSPYLQSNKLNYANVGFSI